MEGHLHQPRHLLLVMKGFGHLAQSLQQHQPQTGLPLLPSQTALTASVHCSAGGWEEGREEEDLVVALYFLVACAYGCAWPSKQCFGKLQIGATIEVSTCLEGC